MPFSRATDDAVRRKPIEFIAPRSAIDAIDVAAVVRQATEDGVVRPQIEVSSFASHVGWTRVTCRIEMTLRLVAAWREAAGKTAIDAQSEERLAAMRRAAVAA